MSRYLGALLALLLAFPVPHVEARSRSAFAEPLPFRPPAYAAKIAPQAHGILKSAYRAETLNRVLWAQGLELEEATLEMVEEALWERLEAVEMRLEGAISLEALVEVQGAIADLETVEPVLREKRKEFEQRLGALYERAEKAVKEKTEKVIWGKFSRLGAPEWAGRTAHYAMPNGDVLALKRFSRPEDPQDEAKAMLKARRFGVRTPIPIPAKVPHETGRPYSMKEGGSYFLPYLIPRTLARGYRSYVNEGGSFNAVSRGFMRGIDDLVSLARHGHAHESLAAVSHGDGHWEWDYWRWVTPFFGKMRFGPSNIRKNDLRFPNLRLSGLADYEHIRSLRSFVVEHDHYNHGNVKHDAFSAALGQNLTEFAFLVMDAGKLNGWSVRKTVDLIWAGLDRYMRQALPSDASVSVSPREMREGLRVTVRRIRRFGLKGFAIHPLVVGVISPMVEALREKSWIEGPRFGHPTSFSEKEKFKEFLAIGFILSTFGWLFPMLLFLPEIAPQDHSWLRLLFLMAGVFMVPLAYLTRFFTAWINPAPWKKGWGGWLN